MNLRKKTPQPALPGSDSEIVHSSIAQTKNQEPSLGDRPNRRITQTAKYLINFLNQVNREAREAKRKKEKKVQEEIQKPDPVKKIKPEKPIANIVLPPKVVPKPVQRKIPIQKEIPKSANDYYKFTAENPFGIQGFDPKRVHLPHGFPLDFMVPQNKPIENIHQYMPTNFDYLAMQNQFQNMKAYQGLPSGIHGIPKMPTIQGMQNLQGLQGIQGLPGIQGIQGLPGMQGMPGIQSLQGIQGLQGLQGIAGLQGIQGIQNIPGIGLVQMGPNNSQIFFNGGNYVRLPMMPQQIHQPPQNMNMKIGNQKKMFKRASYHAAIAYYIHLQKLKKKSQVEQLDEAFIDPTYRSRKMREGNRGNNIQVIQEQPPPQPAPEDQTKSNSVAE